MLSNPLVQTYLPNSAKKIQFHQELLVLFWKLCDFNKVWICFLLSFTSAWLLWLWLDQALVKGCGGWLAVALGCCDHQPH